VKQGSDRSVWRPDLSWAIDSRACLLRTRGRLCRIGPLVGIAATDEDASADRLPARHLRNDAVARASPEAGSGGRGFCAILEHIFKPRWMSIVTQADHHPATEAFCP